MTEKIEPLAFTENPVSLSYEEPIVVLNDSREIVTWALYSRGMPINRSDAAALAKARPVIAVLPTRSSLPKRA